MTAKVLFWLALADLAWTVATLYLGNNVRRNIKLDALAITFLLFVAALTARYLGL